MEIKLTDLGLNSHYPFYNTFLRYNIRTVEDLMDETKINVILERCFKSTRLELLGFIDLVKHEVYGTPLPADIYLEQLVVPVKDRSELMTASKNDLTNRTFESLLRMGFSAGEVQIFFQHYMYHFKNAEGIRIMDVLDYIMNRFSDKEMAQKIKIYMSAYYDKESNVTLENLKKELKQLQEMKSKLDVKIATLEDKIQTIEATKGSAKKWLKI